MVYLNLGEFTEVVELQALTASPDQAGGTRAPVWEKVTEFFASVEPLRGKRALEYSQIITGGVFIVRTHFQTGLPELNTRARLVLSDGKVLSIHSVVNVGMKNKVFEMICANE